MMMMMKTRRKKKKKNEDVEREGEKNNRYKLDCFCTKA
jgi:hypothetical protein